MARETRAIAFISPNSMLWECRRFYIFTGIINTRIPVMPTHIFPKSQRLKSRKKLQQVFAEGKSIRTKDLRLVYLLEHSDTTDVKCGVGLTTRNFKHAVDRNRIKRLLREAYRLQQHDLKNYAALHPVNLSLFLLYTGRQMPLYPDIYENVGVVLQKLQKAIHAAVPQNT